MHSADRQDRNRRRFSDRFLACIVLLGSSLAAVAIVEGGLRVRNALNPVELGPVIEPDAERGWRARPDYHFSGEVTDCQGNPYEITVTTDAEGFRVFEPARAGRPRILFLGDSFTFARDASQESLYYAVAGAQLGASVVAYGAEGYNNLQAYMVLDEYLERVAPDFVVLQVCSNDIINHSIALTRLSFTNQLQTPQPYLEDDGRVMMRNPGVRTAGRLVAPFRSESPFYSESPFHSELLRSIAYRIDNWGGIAPGGKAIEDVIADDEPEHPLFVESVATTGAIFDMFVERLGGIPLVVFNVDEQDPYHSAFARICEARGIPFLEETPRRLASAQAQGAPVLASDCAHWSNAGHALCGEVLAEEIRSLGLLP